MQPVKIALHPRIPKAGRVRALRVQQPVSERTWCEFCAASELADPRHTRMFGLWQPNGSVLPTREARKGFQ